MIKAINIPNDTLLFKYFNDKVTFTEGINVIYGPNGSGKSLLLNTLAHNTFILNDKGWSKPLSYNEVGYVSRLYDYDIKEYLTYKNRTLKNEDKILYGSCQVDWDGIACFKTNGIIDNKLMNRTIVEIMCGSKNEEDISYETMRVIYKDKLSSGQTSIMYVKNMLDMEVPDLSANSSKGRWDIEYENILANYVLTLPRDGKPTLLIDEIDGFFDFDNLYEFWTKSIFQLAEKYQVIIVTHNPYFVNSNMNIIGKDYFLDSMKKLKALTNF